MHQTEYINESKGKEKELLTNSTRICKKDTQQPQQKPQQEEQQKIICIKTFVMNT